MLIALYVNQPRTEILVKSYSWVKVDANSGGDGDCDGSGVGKIEMRHTPDQQVSIGPALADYCHFTGYSILTVFRVKWKCFFPLCKDR